MNEITAAAATPTPSPRLSWAGIRRHGTSKFYHAKDAQAEGGIRLLERGAAPSIVIVVDRDDFRAKAHLAAWPPGWDGRATLPGGEATFKQNDAGVWQARFADYDDLNAACGIAASAGDLPVLRRPPPKYRPTYERPDVPAPTGPGQFPRPFFQPDRAGKVYSIYRWVGRMPPQFHRRPLGRPVLEIEGEEIRAYGQHIDAAPWRIGGLVVNFERDPRYEAPDHDRFVSTEHLPDAVDRGIINWVPPEKRWKPPVLSDAEIERRIERLTEKRGAALLDTCVETKFSPNLRADYMPWDGNTSDWPEWMMASSVAVTPPMTGGSAHGVTIAAMGIKRRGYPPIRLNDVWLITMPGTGVEGVWAVCDPVDLEEIRSFGQGLDVIDPLPNEPTAIRTQRQVREMHNLLASFNDRPHGPGLPSDVYRPWRDDLKTIEQATASLCIMQGQADYNRGVETRCEAEAVRLERLVQSRFARRPPAYHNYSLEDWLAEVRDLKWVKPRAWTARAKGQRGYMATAAGRAADMEAKIAEWRAKCDAALSRCEQRDDEWADLIAVLHPAPVTQ